MPWIILHLWCFLCVRGAGCRGNKITAFIYLNPAEKGTSFRPSLHVQAIVGSTCPRGLLGDMKSSPSPHSRLACIAGGSLTTLLLMHFVWQLHCQESTMGTRTPPATHKLTVGNFLTFMCFTHSTLSLRKIRFYWYSESTESVFMYLGVIQCLNCRQIHSLSRRSDSSARR